MGALWLPHDAECSPRAKDVSESEKGESQACESHGSYLRAEGPKVAMS